MQGFSLTIEFKKCLTSIWSIVSWYSFSRDLKRHSVSLITFSRQSSSHKQTQISGILRTGKQYADVIKWVSIKWACCQIIQHQRYNHPTKASLVVLCSYFISTAICFKGETDSSTMKQLLNENQHLHAF